MNDHMEIIEVEIDADLLEQLNLIIEPMGLTPEHLIQRFFAWCANPETQAEAIAWLLTCENSDE